MNIQHTTFGDIVLAGVKNSFTSDGILFVKDVIIYKQNI